jgi:hypothetical protein
LTTSPYAWSALPVIPVGQARAVIKKPRPKVQLAKLPRPIARLVIDDNDDYYDTAPDIHVSYRRPELIDQTAAVDDDISDEIKIRLILARKRALAAYNTKWA